MEVYFPRPVNTEDVVINTYLERLVEQMAKNVHEVWAKTRIEQGGRWGEKRDDEKKCHPCLVPYEELSEEEKTYDRNTALETIKLILKLGFKISKGEEPLRGTHVGKECIDNL